MNDARQEIFNLIDSERLRQDGKFGPKQHHPNVHPRSESNWDACSYAGISSANVMKIQCANDVEEKQTNWAQILTEEVAEAVEEGGAKNISLLRSELVQVAAVAVAWIEDIDRGAS